jgi:hypothetical protein
MSERPAPEAPSIPQLIVSRVSAVPGVRAIGLGGSRSIGTALPGSDFDIIIFADKPKVIEQNELRQRIEDFGAKPAGNEKLTELTVAGRKVELFFRTFDRIESEIAHAREGRFRRVFNPLHTLGFISTIVVSYATYCKPLWDPEGRLRQVAASAYPYPEPLRQKMVETFLLEARLALIHAAKVRSPDDLVHLTGLYSRIIGSWSMVLYAANGRYPVIDKGIRQLVSNLPKVPQNFEFRTRAVLRGAAAADLKGAYQEAARLMAEVQAIADSSAPPPAEATNAEALAPAEQTR